MTAVSTPVIQILTITESVATVVTQGIQGPPGPQGPQGPPGLPGDAASADMFFQVSNRFYEIAADETAQQTARNNPGLATIDGGTFN